MSHKTVFIIGAGASKEVNLPIGSQLKNSIADLLTFTGEDGYNGTGTGSEIIAKAFRIKDYQSNRFFEASKVICGAMPQALSIDNFLDARSEDDSIIFCGKLAIVDAILKAEAKSLLSGKKIDFAKIENTWFNSFFQQLMENCKPKDLEERMNSIALIIFNYDRCIEHYFYHALQNYYSISSEAASKLLQKIDIYHPYGVVGLLPWQTSDNSNSIQYGATPEPDQLIVLSQQIKTFSEGTDDTSSQIKSIRSYVKSSKRLVFLGFAFHQLNMDLLSPIPKDNGPSARDRKHIYATGFDISFNDRNDIGRDLKVRLGINSTNEDLVNIEIHNDTCAELFKQNKRGLSFVKKC